jgi:hypothetical protein
MQLSAIIESTESIAHRSYIRSAFWDSNGADCAPEAVLEPGLSASNTAFRTWFLSPYLCGMIDLVRGLAFRIEVAVALQLVEFTDNNLAAIPCQCPRAPKSGHPIAEPTS